jgi:tetratricopeptide (TPR) repeat protein
LVYLRKGNPDSAELFIKKALMEQPANSYYLNNYGLISLRKGDQEGALKLIDESIVNDPDNGWAYRNKAFVFMEQKNYDRALQLFYEASTRRGNVENLYSHWADAFYLSGDLKSACKKLAEARERNEDLSILKWQMECIN